jgi:hypothetical protein
VAVVLPEGLVQLVPKDLRVLRVTKASRDQKAKPAAKVKLVGKAILVNRVCKGSKGSKVKRALKENKAFRVKMVTKD